MAAKKKSTKVVEPVVQNTCPLNGTELEYYHLFDGYCKKIKHYMITPNKADIELWYDFCKFMHMVAEEANKAQTVKEAVESLTK